MQQPFENRSASIYQSALQKSFVKPSNPVSPGGQLKLKNMKKLIIAAFIFAGLAAANTATAQLSININIGNQPAWGPVGYDYARYYYLPEINAYYDVNAGRFMYPDRGRWITARHLPPSYGRINLYNTYKVVVNRNYAPYRDNRMDVAKYGRYKTMHNQVVIRDSRDRKYYESRYHPQHNEWTKDRSYDNRRDVARRNDNRGRGR